MYVYNIAKQRGSYRDFSLAFKNITIKNSLHTSDNKYGLKSFTTLNIWWRWEPVLTKMKLYLIKILYECHRDEWDIFIT